MPNVNTVILDQVNHSSYKQGAADEYPVYMDKLGENSFMLKVEGESMLPRFKPGDLLIIDPSVEPTPGALVIAKLENESQATFKKYRLVGKDGNNQPIIDLIPINPDWPTLRLDANNPGHIVGVVVKIQTDP